MNLNDFFSKPTRIKEAYTSNYPSSTPADAAAAVSSGKAIDDPDIMGSLRSGEPTFGRLNKLAKDPGQIQPLDSEEEEALNNHLKSWQEKIQNLPDPFAPTRTWTRADGTELPASGAGSSSNIAPHGWRYVEKGEDPSTYTFVDPKDKAAAAASKSASAPPALDLTPKSKYKFDRALGQVSVDGSGANANIDADTRARALAWAAQKNAPGGIRAQDVGPDNSAPPATKSAAATAPVASLKDLPVEKPSSWKDIAQANGIDNPNRIMPGQTLKIPGRADYVVKPGDTLAGIAAGKTKAPKSAPSPEQDPAYVAALAKLKKNPNIGVDFPVPPDIQKAMGMGPITTKTYDPFGKEIIKKVGSEELVPADPRRKTYPNTPAGAQASLRDIEKANAQRIAARDAAQANRKKTNEDDIDEDTMDDGFKWGSPTMPMQDGSVMNFNPQTNSYKQASPPTKPNLNTSMSTITRDRTTDKNGQSNQNYSDISIATNPATGTGDYMHRQDVNGVPTTTFRQNVPADELAKLRAGAGIPPAQQAVKESLDRMRSLAGIRKK